MTATGGEDRAIRRAVRRRSRLPTILGVAGLVIVGALVVTAVFAPWLAPYDPTERIARPFLFPSAEHPLGTNDVGHDLLSEIIFGSRVSLMVGLVAATVEVTMGTLRTDNSSRDSQVRRALGTNDFPHAVFTLAEPVELPAGMADGEAFSGSAHGDLTIKGVTDRVTFDLQAQLVDDTIVAVGSSDVVFSDFGVTAPSAPIVVSVEDNGIMEFQLLFTR